MGEQHHVTVIGAGIVGMACAVALLRDGHKVTVLDPDKPESLLDVLAHHRAARDGQPIHVHLWDRAWLLFVLLSWMGVEWLIRRAWGLP